MFTVLKSVNPLSNIVCPLSIVVFLKLSAFFAFTARVSPSKSNSNPNCSADSLFLLRVMGGSWFRWAEFAIVHQEAELSAVVPALCYIRALKTRILMSDLYQAIVAMSVVFLPF